MNDVNLINESNCLIDFSAEKANFDFVYFDVKTLSPTFTKLKGGCNLYIDNDLKSKLDALESITLGGEIEVLSDNYVELSKQDDILDKISKSGVISLTKNDLNLLHNTSV